MQRHLSAAAAAAVRVRAGVGAGRRGGLRRLLSTAAVPVGSSGTRTRVVAGHQHHPHSPRRAFSAPASAAPSPGGQEVVREMAPGIAREEYVARRAALAASLPPHSVAIVPAATQQFASHAVPYRFRQETSFYYLTGVLEPDAVLIVRTGADQTVERCALSVSPRSASDELWSGALPGMPELAAATGVDDALTSDHLDLLLRSELKRSQNVYFDANFKTEGPHHAGILSTIRARTVQPRSVGAKVDQLRVLKSPQEMAILRDAAWVSSQGFMTGMAMCHPGMNENVLDATLEYVCRCHSGSQMIGYPPVVAGGERARTIHYLNNDQDLRGGDLVLVDAGSEVKMYISDVTRTWPVSGEFSDAQRSLYQAVLSVQNGCIAACLSGEIISLAKLHALSEQLMFQELSHLGLLSRVRRPQALLRRLYPHAVGHYLGLDIHDTNTVGLIKAFEPGMVYTVEPGCYVPHDDDIPEEFRGIGIRIEDNIAQLEDGPYVLTHETPKEVEDLENIVGTV